MFELEDTYLSTTYKVFSPSLALRIGEKHPELDVVLREHQALSWAFLTAWNPFSKPLTLSENRQRNRAMANELKEELIFSGQGEGTDPAWLPEESFLVLGLRKQKSLELALKYQQNAFVWGDINEAAQLIWCSKIH